MRLVKLCRAKGARLKWDHVDSNDKNLSVSESATF